MYARPGTPAGANSVNRSSRSRSPSGMQTSAPGSLREIGDAAEVVEVPVRDEDRGARRAEPRELEAQRGRVAARVDDGGLGRVAVRADDVAVRLQRSERVSVDDERHRGESKCRVYGLRGRGHGCHVQHWKLNEIETPDGTRSPVVLHSQEGESACRADRAARRGGARRPPGARSRRRSRRRRRDGARRGRRRGVRRGRRRALPLRARRAALGDERRRRAACCCSLAPWPASATTAAAKALPLLSAPLRTLSPPSGGRRSGRSQYVNGTKSAV